METAENAAEPNGVEGATRDFADAAALVSDTATNLLIDQKGAAQRDAPARSSRRI